MPADPPIIQAIPGCIVTRVAVDDSFTLTLCGVDREVVLRIDGSGEVVSAGSTAAFDPDRDPMTVAPLLGLLNQRVDEAHIEEDGTLVVGIGGSRMRVFPSEHAVTWSMRGPDGTKASCLAEGRVVWE